MADDELPDQIGFGRFVLVALSVIKGKVYRTSFLVQYVAIAGVTGSQAGHWQAIEGGRCAVSSDERKLLWCISEIKKWQLAVAL